MTRELAIDGCLVADETDAYIVAEIGHNHQGNLDIAKELFKAAKDSGANAAKLQKRHNRTLYTRELYEAPYDNENSYGRTYGLHREALEFGLDEYRELQRYAHEIGITFFSTAFDFASADFLASLAMPAYKIASGDLTNVPLLQHVAGFQRPMLLSTGGATIEDVERAYDAVAPINTQISFLQCTAGYPCAFEEMNLRVISSYRERFPSVVVGLSSHDNGIAMPVAAYVLGARIIEKHFTLNRASKGTDHAFSLERTGLQKLVRDLRRTRVALGDGIKRPHASERQALYKMAKKLVAARDLPAGHMLTPKDIAIKSPNDGLPPYEFENVLGMVTLRELREDETLQFSDLAPLEMVGRGVGFGAEHMQEGRRPLATITSPES